MALAKLPEVPAVGKSFPDAAVKTTEQKKKDMKYNRDKDREMVKGIFRFHECPGSTMSFVFRAYKEDPVEKFEMIDGHSYTVPLGVAKHLNKNGWYPVHAHMTNEDGSVSMKVGQKVRRFSFQSLEFIETEDLSPTGMPIISVEMSGF